MCTCTIPPKIFKLIYRICDDGGSERYLSVNKLGSHQPFAINLSLKPVGLLGVLLRAKQEKLITAVRPLIDRLRDEADFFIHDSLYDEVVLMAGE